jgi:hypothetical protein
LNGSSEPKSLRLWIKAFIEVIPQILLDFKDTELIEQLLFVLPWLCHGKSQEKKIIDNSPLTSPSKVEGQKELI